MWWPGGLVSWLWSLKAMELVSWDRLATAAAAAALESRAAADDCCC